MKVEYLELVKKFPEFNKEKHTLCTNGRYERLSLVHVSENWAIRQFGERIVDRAFGIDGINDIPGHIYCTLHEPQYPRCGRDENCHLIINGKCPHECSSVEYGLKPKSGYHTLWVVPYANGTHYNRLSKE